MRQEKQLLLDEIKEGIGRYESFTIMNYKGLTANQANDFRNHIVKLGGEIMVVRKRILVKAAEAAGVKLDISALQGHIGLVYSGTDPIETTKAVVTFSKNNGKIIEVIGGRFDGQLYNGKEVERLAALPGKDEMRAQLLAVLEAPISHTLGAMDALLSSVVYCLDNKSKEGSEK